MAERDGRDVFLIELMRCKEEIVLRLEEIERRVSERKQILLAEIAWIQKRYEKSLEARRAVIKLEKSRERILKNIGEVNDLLFENNPEQGILKSIDDSISKWQLSLEVFENVCLTFNGETELLSCIRKLGQIQFEGEDYQTRTEPLFLLRPQEMEFESLFGVSTDTHGNIYSADNPNGRIVVFFPGGTAVYDYIEDQHLKGPYDLCVWGEDMFVTDIIYHSLVKFNCDGTFLKTVGMEGNEDTEFKKPFGLDIDSDNLIYVCDRDNHRISVYDTNLRWKRIIKQNGITYPRNIKIRDNLFILYAGNNFCVLSKSGELIYKIPSIAHDVTEAFWFCLDKTGNILISDYREGEIKVFTPTGMLNHTLGSADPEDGMRRYCQNSQGITITQDGEIISVCGTPNTSLYIF